MRTLYKRIVACIISSCLVVPYSVGYKHESMVRVDAATSADLSLSQNGVEFICKYESYQPYCYHDNTQQSIGYGSKCGDGSLHTEGAHYISKSDALQTMISKVNSEYAPHVRWATQGLTMTQNQFDALCSMCYNTWQVEKSPLVRYLKGEISEATARAETAEFRINKGTKYENGLRNRRKAEADLFFSGSSPVIIPPTSDGCFPACGSAYSSIVEALKSIGVDSSYNYRAKIAAANGIQGYSGTASQNIQLLDLLKSGKLQKPTDGGDNVPDPPPVVDYSETYFPSCSSSFTSIVDALKSIGVDSSMSNRTVIAQKNGITNYSGTADQNTQLLSLLKSGRLINPNGSSAPTTDNSKKYYPACGSSYTSIVDALKSIGEDSSYNNRSNIAAKNGISGYSGSASQNTQLLNLLKSGQLIRVDYVEPPVIVNYIITLDACSGFTPISSMEVASNSKYNGLPNATREGYTFGGWFTSASGGTKVNNNDSLVSASNHTLYAHWTANKYTLSFDNNDSTGVSSTKNVTYGQAYGELPSPKKTGYTLAGWYTDFNGNNQVKSDSKYNVADNQTLYAQWNPNTYTVKFDSNGGTDSIADKTVKYDDLYGTMESPVRDGYEFIGWFTEKEKGSQISGDSRVTITATQVLYAHWAAVQVQEALKIEESSITLYNGDQYTIKANQENLTFKSNNINVAVVSDKGIVTAIGEGNALISVINSESDVVQLKVKVVPPMVKGDCNSDGEANIADAVMLQKWLLGNTKELTNWRAVDLCEDERIDVFDMVLLRRLIIENMEV